MGAILRDAKVWLLPQVVDFETILRVQFRHSFPCHLLTIGWQNFAAQYLVSRPHLFDSIY